MLISVLARPPRDDQEHRRLGREYQNIADEKEQQLFFKEHASRWFELSRLPYFNPVRMAIIDPMHNILLGAHSG